MGFAAETVRKVFVVEAVRENFAAVTVGKRVDFAAGTVRKQMDLEYYIV
jgi:hypothetical protein